MTESNDVASALPAEPAPSGPPRTAATLRIFGALLWAYVVLGEWVIGLSFPEPFAVLCLILVFGAAWLTSVRRGPGASALDKSLPGPLAFALCALLLLLTSALADGTTPARVEAVSASLCFIGAATFHGATLWYRAAPLPSGPVWAHWLAWGLGGVATLLAIVSALSRL
jgi:hypothetical protein